MPKHKTREQKVKADERRHAQVSQMQQTPLYSFSQHQFTAVTSSKRVEGNTITLVQHDIKKTTIISLGIVALQLILFFLLKNHVLAIHFVSY